MKKGQAAIMDAFFFLMICSMAATLLFYTVGLYGANTNKQIITIYNYEYAGTALVSLHYAKDSSGGWFWSELKILLEEHNPESQLQTYFNGGASDIWEEGLEKSSPSEKFILRFKREGSNEEIYCYGSVPSVRCRFDPPWENMQVYSSSVKLFDADDREWLAVLELYY